MKTHSSSPNPVWQCSLWLWLVFSLSQALEPSLKAAEFGINSATISNKYFPLNVGATFNFRGLGVIAGTTASHQATAIDTADGVRCVKVVVNAPDGILYEWLAQDKTGAVWQLRQYDVSGKEYDDEDYLLMPANPQIGDRCTLWILDYEVASITAQVTVSAGTFSNCLHLRCVDSAWPGEEEYYAPFLGEVKTFDGSGGYELTSVTGMNVPTNPVDAQKPLVFITSPTPLQRWSNALFTVKGTASDNGGLAAVWCQVNNGGWAVATGTTNWTASVTLTPGANAVQAYAVDLAGNKSPTNAVSFTYVLSAPVTVQTVGTGTLTPNYNGQWLELGKSFTMTATPGLGFAFNGWSGSASSGAPTLSFVMQSNLVFTATFGDVQKPAVVISSPTPLQRWSNALFTVKGTASDNGGLAAVWCQVNNGGWAVATGTTNWTANVTLTPGANAVQAYAVDLAGNKSPTNAVSFTYVLSAPVTVQTVGTGTLTPNYNGQWLELGKSFTMTATPGLGFAFNGWSGSASSGAPTLSFVMQSNLVFTATFWDVQKPAVVISSPTPLQRWSNALFAVKGTASDNGGLAAVWCQVNNGGWAVATGTTNWTANVTLTPGANAVQAYAVDLAGNKSPTNAMSFTYVLSAPVTVQTVGTGTLTPNYSGQWLELGKSFTMTATPGLGFAFNGWSGSASSGAPTLSFVMQSNLVFTATFGDVQKPAVVISSPTPLQRWSNALFTVKGTASDNGGLAAVWCQVNNGGWAVATGTTNWTASVTLTPGANAVQAYAVDLAGNKSPTNAVSFTYVLSAPVTVQTVGTGTLTPNYNGQWLELGKSFTMTATPGLGFAFNGWSGSASSGAPTLSFVMQSNLVFTATFGDVQKPAVVISSPTPLQRWSNALFAVKGTASDNGGLAAVWCQINNGGWAMATGTTNWTANVTLTPGANAVQAYAVDLAGNKSPTNAVSFTYVLSAPVTVQTVGTGTLTPNYIGQWLELGKSFTMTATPGLGFAFNGWSGSASSGAPTLSFVMQSNLVFTATFGDVQKPAVVISSPTPLQRWSNALFTVKGTASDNGGLAAVWCQVNNGGWAMATGTTNWTANVTLTPGANAVQAYAVDLAGNKSPTNAVSFTYVLSAPVTVQTVGTGTLTPNYIGQWLELGKSFTMTATPGLGFAFNGWSGSASSGAPTLSFVMQSNLVFTATFGDVQKPAVVISSPTPLQRWSNALFTVKGTASDNGGLAAVWCQVNNGGWAMATGTTNWTANVTLTPGANAVQAYAVDLAGNKSPTNAVSFTYVLSAPVTVQTVGTGTLTPNYNGQWLELGKSFTMTATPGLGFAFNGWSGSASGGAPTLSFVMQSNLAYTATFVDVQKPAVVISSPTPLQRWSNALFTVKGTASDNGGLASVWCQVNNGGWAMATGTTNWTANVTLTPGANAVQAYAVDLAGNKSPTNAVSFTYYIPPPPDWAPSQLVSKRIAITHDGGGFSSTGLAFDAATFSVIGDTGMGNYTYVRLTTNIARLIMSYTTPPNMAVYQDIATCTCTGPNRGTYTLSRSGGTATGSFQIFDQPDIVPASLAGKAAIMASGSISFGSTAFTMIQPAYTTQTGTYTYTRYSPVAGLIVLHFSTPAEMVRAVDYVEATFSDSQSGTMISTEFDYPGDSPDVRWSNFTVASATPGKAFLARNPGIPTGPSEKERSSQGLDLRVVGDQLILSWPQSASPYALEFSATVGAGGAWSQLTQGIGQVEGCFVFTNTIRGSAGYYRLRQP